MTRAKVAGLAFGMVAGGFILVLALAVVTGLKHRQEEDTVPDRQKIARTLEIIRDSTPQHRQVLKVLFYGQSISKSGWHLAVVDHWRRAYPNTEFVVANRAVGGFAASALLRTTEQDIAAFYPDLIVFHVYGDHRDYERIIRLFRSRTAADVIVQTDHGEVLPDPPCVEGLQRTLHRPPGCAGVGWLHQRLWGDEMSYHKIPAFAKKYGLALEAQRGWWREYLLRNHLRADALLQDDIHPNEKGKALMARYFIDYFDALVRQWPDKQGPDGTKAGVDTLAPAAVRLVDGIQELGFDGDRIEMLSSEPFATMPQVFIDTLAPRDIDHCYQATRPSALATATDWPAVRRVTLLQDHTAQSWVATLRQFSPDQKTFQFSVKSSVEGEQGSGTSSMDFTSRSGRLRIDAQDWMIERAFVMNHVAQADPYEVTWTVNFICGNDPEIIELGGGTRQYRYVLAAGLSKGHHRLTFAPRSLDLSSVSEFRVYRPALQDH